MGMFDYVDFECACPACGALVSGFQTKDTDCLMDTVAVGEARHFYSDCPECDAWVEFTLEPVPQGQPARLVVKRMRKSDPPPRGYDRLVDRAVVLRREDDGWHIDDEPE